uniref:Interferon gamma n=1 Tax=Oryzias sinensis TaxID=183150 RepID=A0A8C7Y4L6_9TELE
MRMMALMKVILCLWLTVTGVSASYVPQEMNKTIQNLLQHYKIPLVERFNGNPVFPKDGMDGNVEMKMIFMHGVLETYEDLIGHMLKQLPTASPPPGSSQDKPASPGTSNDDGAPVKADVRSKLMYILEKIQFLKTHRYQEQEKLLHRLQNLKKIQMDNRTVQSKALWELPQLFEKASSLADNTMRRRRRRQARNRMHLKA